MLNVHFNGEIVRCKDMRLISHYTKERNDAENRCKYGMKLLDCKAWTDFCLKQSEIKSITERGTCKLCSTKDCPAYKQRKEAGLTQKNYKIDWHVYRKISSCTHFLIKESKDKTLFLTLTFPRFKYEAKNNHIKKWYYDYIANQSISRFGENLRKNYGCNGYIAVKEYGEATNRVHFHIVFSIPFVDFRRINRAWNSSINDFCFFSACSVRRAPGTPAIIRNPVRAIRYVCKYISKSYGVTSESKMIFISKNLLSQQITLIKPKNKIDLQTCEAVEQEPEQELQRISNTTRRIIENEFNHIDYLKTFKSLKIDTFEHVTVFKITDRKEFNKFCWQFLYPLFECSMKFTEFYYTTEVEN